MSQYIEVSAEVRYWEDASVNCAEDSGGTLIPFRRGSLWCPVIRLKDGQVMDWPQGTEANIHYKVCDAGQYWLLDASRRRVAEWAGHYVPNDFLCHGDEGYGDYVILTVGPDGVVRGWYEPEIVWGGREDDETGWKRLSPADPPPMTTEIDVMCAGNELAARARAAGFVITIDQQSLQPPAMGRHVDIVTIRQVRGAA